FRRFHDRLNLLHVVDVKRGQAVIVFGGMVEQQTHRYKRHDRFSWRSKHLIAMARAKETGGPADSIETAILPPRTVVGEGVQGSAPAHRSPGISNVSLRGTCASRIKTSFCCGPSAVSTV